MISRMGRQHQQALLRDSGQSHGAGHDLFAAFSCSRFRLLDIGRMESPPARAARFTLSAALRALPARGRRSNRRIASAVPALRKLKRAIQTAANLTWKCGYAVTAKHRR